MAVADQIRRASLADAEQRTLERLVRDLAAELGDELHAVWLYGSRARGGQPHEESDVDLMVIVKGDWDRHNDWVGERANAAAEAEGMSPSFLSVMVHDLDWLAERRAIRAFFIQEVDRDKVVLWGSGLEDVGGTVEHGGVEAGDGSANDAPIMTRSAEYLAKSRKNLRAARLMLENDLPGIAVSPAYYSMLYAARAALSEEDLFARTHQGTWHLVHETFVTTGRLDPDLHSRAQQAQKQREGSDYEAKSYPVETASATVDAAERFLAAVVAMLG